jgi:hypothetical protein
MTDTSQSPAPQQDNLVIDPLGMNIVNRIAPESSMQGDVTFSGGVLVQGNLAGAGLVMGFGTGHKCWGIFGCWVICTCLVALARKVQMPTRP